VFRTHKAFALVMALVLVTAVFGMVGCGQQEEPAKVGLVFDVGGRGDLSFNDSAYAGLEKAMNEFGIEATTLSPTEGGENREELLRTLAEEGYELIFAIGFLFTEAVQTAAVDFPEANFALVDGFIPDLTAESNVVCLGFAEHEGSFLVGAAAALHSEVGKVGFVGGMKIPLIEKFEYGFMAGAKYINPDIEIVRNYIGSTGEAFSNPTAGRELALAQFNAGCDIVYHASGKSGIGVIQAAAETDNLAIGVDSDQYLQYGETNPEEQPYIFTSMLKRVDVSVYETIKKYLDGEFEGGYATFTLANDGVGYAKTNEELITPYIEQLDELKAQIANGEITVPYTQEQYEEFVANLGG